LKEAMWRAKKNNHWEVEEREGAGDKKSGEKRGENGTSR